MAKQRIAAGFPLSVYADETKKKTSVTPGNYLNQEIVTAINLVPGVGSLTLTGRAPSGGISYNLTPGAGSIALVSYAATLGYGLAPGAGSLTLAGKVPSAGGGNANLLLLTGVG